MRRDNVVGPACMPRPLTALGLSVLELNRLIEWGDQAASVKEGNKVTAQPPLRFNDLLDNGGPFKHNLSSKFLHSSSAYPILGSLLVADHAAWDMPASPEDFIITPRQQDTPLTV